MGTEFPWRWGRGTISANLDVIWGMSGKMDNRGGHQYQNTADERLNDVPKGPTKIQIALLAGVEKSQRDQLGDQTADGGSNHRDRRQLNWLPWSHRSHDQNEDRHNEQEDAVPERPDDLRSIRPECALETCGAPGDAGGDQCQHHAANC